MTQWYVKGLSKLTQVSVQTLHHYDRIGLLKPSVRLANDYRVYSEKDLSKLQQIIALKFFGFKLSHIKKLLSSDVEVVNHLAAQSKLLEEKAKTLTEASEALKNIIANYNPKKSIPWETIINLIGVYRMTQQLEKTWVGEIFTPEELRNYAEFENELKTRFTENEIKASEKEWVNLVREVHANLDKDPVSAFGINVGKRCMDRINRLYSKKHLSLRIAIWEKVFKGGHGKQEHGLSSEGVNWLDQAMCAYHLQKIFEILNKINENPSNETLKSFEAHLFDLSGDESSHKNKIYDAIMRDHRSTPAIKKWLKTHIG